MSIELIQPRLPQTATIRLLDWGADLTPPGGGPSQRLNRLGDRFSLEIVYPRLNPEPDGRILMSQIRRAKREGALFPVPQPGLNTGAPGTPVVDGAAQQGSSLTVRGFAAGYPMLDGQFFSIIYAGQRYLHHVAQTATAADGNGAATFSIFPMLRISPNDGATLEFAKPYIEGVLSGNETSVELAIARATPATITITERD